MMKKLHNIFLCILLLAIASPLSLDAHHLRNPRKHVISLNASKAEGKTKAALPLSPKRGLALELMERSRSYEKRVLRVLENNRVLTSCSSNGFLEKRIKDRIEAKTSYLLSKAASAKTMKDLQELRSAVEESFPVNRG